MLPDYLSSTYRLVAAAFPGGIDIASYLPLLRLLGEHMSQRNLADVIAAHTGREVGLVYNDVLHSDSAPVPDEQMDRVRAMLEAAGFETWKTED